MASIPVGELRPGMRLAYDVRDGSGRLLLAARRSITEDVLSALHSRAVIALPLRPPEELPEGVLGEDVPRRSWLLADSSSGQDDAAADGAREGIRTVQEAREGSRMRSALRRATDGVIAHRSSRWKRLALRVRAEGEMSGVRMVEDVAVGFDDAPGLWSAERVELVRRMFARLADGQIVGTGTPNLLVHEMMDEAGRRPGALVRGAIEGVRELDDLAAHAYATACVSVEIAAGMGWRVESVRAAGLAGLLADCGLGLLPWDVRNEPRELTDVEQNAVRRHPAYSAAMLELLRAEGEDQTIPEEVQLAVYQHHEREDGTGYPLRTRGEMIHDVARAVGVADVLVGMVSARAHRPAMDPTSALASVARLAHAGTLALLPARALAEAMVAAGMGVRIAVRSAGGMRAAA